MSAAENKRLIQSGFEAWANGGNFFELLADDVRWTISGSSPTAGTYRSREEFLAKVIKPIGERLAGPIRPTVEVVVAENDYVVVMWSGRATTKTGKPYNNHYCWVMRLAEGKIKEATAFFDDAALAAIW